LLKAVSHGTKGKHLCLCHGVIGSLAVAQDTGKLRNLSDPATINLLLALDTEIHDGSPGRNEQNCNAPWPVTPNVELTRSVSLKPGKSRPALTLTHPNAAGIDIGSASHFVAVPPDRCDEPVREFPSFTVDLNARADWFEACGMDTVAMESTGVYWIPLFELLESRGFTVLPTPYLLLLKHPAPAPSPSCP
jgi:hypothetical protein